MAYVVTTVSGTTYLKDLGYRNAITHPSSVDLTSLGFTLEEIDRSIDLQDALLAGTITANNNGNAVVVGFNVTTPAKHSSTHTNGIDDIQNASGSQKGLLTSSDWNTFNNKQTALGFTAVPETRTVNGKSLSSNITLGLASSDFSNQGTTSTVLHGNAAGNPAFSAVDLATDISGILPVANGGTGSTTPIGANDSLHIQGTPIVSAATTSIGSATGDFIDITGTTTITSLGTGSAGDQRVVRFTGALILTHNATSLILPGNANITTAVNDRATFRSLGGSNWICIHYNRSATIPFSGITLTGNVTGSGSGSFATTIANNSVTNARLATMPANSIKGNNTGSVGAALDLTGAQTTALLNSVTGDSGSGGIKGLVPAPAAGDAAGNKFLKADGTWSTTPGGSGTVTSVSVTTANGFSGTVANPTSTPAITISTGVTGVLKGNGTSVSAAIAGTDYQVPLGFTAEDSANKSNNTSLGNSSTLYPTQNAVKTYVDNSVVGLLDDRGNYNASGNSFPNSGGSGTAGAVLKGDLWTVSVSGTLGGFAVTAGDVVRALVDTPGQTASNWAISENNFGYVAENQANKSTDGTLAANSTTLYPSQSAVKTYADTKVIANSAITGATNTKITYDAKGLVTAGAPAVLDSSDFANQGTTSTVLHGNAAGNPSFGAVSLTADVSGILPVTNGGSGVTTSTGTGNNVLPNSPTLVTPNLGTPSTLVGTNITGTAAGLTAGNVTTNANLTGPITSIGNATSVTVNAITNTMLAQVATATFKGRTTAGTGNSEDLTVSQAKTLLNLAGTNTGDQTITLTGDVTGSGTGSFATTIANNAVTNTKFRQGVARSVIGVTGNAAANVADIQGAADQVLRVNTGGTALAFGQLNLAAAAAVTGSLPIANGGTGQATQTTAFNALSPVTTKGDLIARDSTNNIRLPVGADNRFLVADSSKASGLDWKALDIDAQQVVGGAPLASIDLTNFHINSGSITFFDLDFAGSPNYTLTTAGRSTKNYRVTFTSVYGISTSANRYTYFRFLVNGTPQTDFDTVCFTTDSYRPTQITQTFNLLNIAPGTTLQVVYGVATNLGTGNAGNTTFRNYGTIFSIQGVG
jgi:hypothetical protein